MLGPSTRLAAILAAEDPAYDAAAAGSAGGLPPRLYHEVVDRAIAMHGGRTFELEPDHTLAEFVGAADAVRCAQQIQDGLRAAGALPAGRRSALRIGVHYGEVMVERFELSGPALDIALRIKSLAAPGEICVSRAVRERVTKRLDLASRDLAAIKGRDVPHAGLAYRIGEPAQDAHRSPEGLSATVRLGAVALLAAALAWLTFASGGAP